MSKILGIDLGTTNSAMAIMEGGEPKIIENSEGARTTPSMVAANKSGERLAGILAKRQAVTNAENTIFSVKRLIGRRFLDQEVQRDKQWLPYTIREASNGGGTFDVSVLEISTDTVEVKATGGDTHLGGDDFDKRLIEWMVDEFKKDQGIDLSRDKLALQRLKEAAERAKHELSSTHETEINIPFITSDAEGPKHLLLKLSRSKLEELVNDHIEKAAQIVAKVVGEAKFALSDINEVVMVGGQTRMPAIQDSVRKLFGKEPHTGINPDEVVAIGAAAQGGIMEGEVHD